jgi:HlyD family secretion protein
MDIPRQTNKRSRQVRRILYGVSAVAAVALITLGISKMKPANQSVDAQTVWIDTVKRGSMLRQVRGLGTLVPEDIRWIPASTQGRVERILAKPGAMVSPDSVIIELSNPELQQAALDADSALRAAQAQLASLNVQLKKRALDQEAAAATVGADYKNAKLQAQVNEQLKKDGLIADLPYNQSKVRAEELEHRLDIEKKRLSMSSAEVKAQLDAQQALVQQAKDLADLRRSQLATLTVRAGINGVLQQMEVEVGQQVTPGQNLARVSDPTQLKAELRISETQTKDITIGLPVAIDTRNGIVPGRVIRIDPAATNGTVRVDVGLEGELPKGARPDLSVDGTIELERLEQVLYVGRPVHGSENSVIGLFKLEPDGKEAVRTQVRLGRSSVNTVEILDGLREGDRVILSDTSQWDSADRIDLK